MNHYMNAIPDSSSMTRLPLYFNCYINSSGVERKLCYLIDASNIAAHPYQLFKYNSNVWENLSVYASIRDAVMILLKELLSGELADEVNHGQATVNPNEILDRITQGERTVSIYSSSNYEMFRIDFDVMFDDLVERT